MIRTCLTFLQRLALAGATLLALLPAAAAPVDFYGAFKVHRYGQSGPVPAEPLTLIEDGFYAYSVGSAPGAVLLASVSSGGVPLFMLQSQVDPTLSEVFSPFDTETALDAAWPNGNYAFQFFDPNGAVSSASISLSGTAYPTAPVLKNFAAAQDLDRTQPFTLQWDKPPELDAADYVTVEIFSDSNLVAGSPKLWAAGALPGTATSFTIPANVLPVTGRLYGTLSFINVTTTKSGDLPGSLGSAGHTTQTDFPLELHVTGGGVDTTPPVLLVVNPLRGAVGVAATTAVSFTFSEAMKAQQTITWTGVPSPASFIYTWSGDGSRLTCTYPGGFPGGSTVTWKLTANAFKDVAGNQLLAPLPSQLTSSFTVAATGTVNCTSTLGEGANTFLVARLANFLQNSAGAPLPGALEGDPSAAFIASFFPSGISLTGAEVGLPGGQSPALGSAAGVYFLQRTFDDEAALAAAFGTGSYTARLLLAPSGTASLAVNLGASPTTPHSTNYDAAQAINAAADFTLAWDALAGAGVSDRIEITIRNDQDSVVFRRPDDCATPPLPLAATATSVTIPANTFQAGNIYTVGLAFFKVSGQATNPAPAFTALGAYLKTTFFNIATTGGTANITPIITSARLTTDNHFETDVTASPGRTLTLEATSNYTMWTPVGTATVPASGKATFRDSRVATEIFQVYRVRSE